MCSVYYACSKTFAVFLHAPNLKSTKDLYRATSVHFTESLERTSASMQSDFSGILFTASLGGIANAIVGQYSPQVMVFLAFHLAKTVLPIVLNSNL